MTNVTQVKTSNDGNRADNEPAAQSMKIDKSAARQPDRTIRVKVVEDEYGARLVPDHPDIAVGCALLMESIGTKNPAFLNGFLYALKKASAQNDVPNEGAANFMLSIVQGNKPQDQNEAMLCALMAGMFMETMMAQNNLGDCATRHSQAPAQYFNKLAGTFVSLLEGLKRYRTGSDPLVRVQNVSISDGSQAIVGNVTQTQRESLPDKAPAQPLALSDTKMTPMPPVGESKARAPIRIRAKGIK